MESYVDQVYSNDRKMPPGCDCRKTGDTDRECTLFECTCICDLTAGMCDHNCCCDHECTGTQRARFEDLERCEPEGPVAEEVTKCYSTKVVDRVNPRFPMTAKGTAKSSLDRMLCVRYDNSDLRGEYYEDPGYPSSSVFDDSDGQKDFDYPEWATTSLETYAKDQTYDAGDPIRAAFSYDAEDAWSGFDTAALLNSETGEYGFVEAHGGVLPLPMADERGECLETQRALFAAAQNSECLRVIDNLEADCPNLGSFRFASRLFLGKHAGASPAGSDWVHVEVRRVRWRDFEAGTEYEYSSFDPDLAACDVAYDGPFTATLAPTLSMEDTNSSTDQSPTPVPSLTVAPTAVCALGENASRPASPSCRNALVEICYVIVYGGETENSQIIRAYADLVLTDIPAMSSVTAMRQRYSIAFQSESSAVRSITDANIVNRTRSGNPGYIFGRPVLAGKLASAAYVLPRIDGLRMLGSSGDSTCSEDGVESLAVAFGVDTKSGCVLKLTRGELRDFCTGDSTHAFANGLPRYFNASADLVFDGVTNDLADDVIGIFGNADPLDPTQWLDLDIKAAAAGNAALWLERQGSFGPTSAWFRRQRSRLQFKKRLYKTNATRVDIAPDDFALSSTPDAGIATKVVSCWDDSGVCIDIK
ncbi:hypothetical protein CTAYLR_002925 [Chrysophaeum taylorii]|uniref:Tectonic domain-containing protein n=1 Tax=Chrysophaeum taylorii TaxID=2483200 RepID=A0AAD7UNQ6_9STRA|nr:hypothetical protein CTAYLR_002925 [Chrysophaeum taylorii]